MKSCKLIPIIAGGAAAVVLVIVFAQFLIASDKSSGQTHLTLTIEGLKDKYKTGEEVDFAMNVSGYGQLCTNPNVQVQNSDTKQVVWFSSTSINSSCEPAHEINEEFHPRGIGRTPIILNEIGTYRLGASVGEEPVWRNFTVVS